MLKLPALLLFGAAVVVFARLVHASLTRRWNDGVAAYARWVSVEFDSMFEEVSIERARRIILLSMLSGFVLGFLMGAGLVSRLVLGGILAAVGYNVPRLVTKYLQSRRMQRIDGQLVDSLVLMSNSLKSGLSLVQALEMVVREMRPPVSDEFGRMVKEIQLGRLTDDALLTFTERVPLEDVKLAVDAIMTLRETGGNLSETFQVIAHTIGERKKVEGKISSMTAQGMTQGIVMCAMPLIMMGIFVLMDPNYMDLMFSTPIGLAMVVLVFLLDVAGYWMMRQAVQVDV